MSARPAPTMVLMSPWLTMPPTDMVAMPSVLRMRSLSARLVGAAVDRMLRTRYAARRNREHVVAGRVGACARSQSRRRWWCRPRPSPHEEIRVMIGLCCGQAARTALNTSSGTRIGSRAGRRMRRCDGSKRRDERQIDSRVPMQLDRVEPRGVGHLGDTHDGIPHEIHVVAVHLAGVLTPVRERDRRWSQDFHSASPRNGRLPTSASRRLSARMASWIAIFAALYSWMNRDALPRADVLGRIHAGAMQADAALGQHVGHLGDHEAGAADARLPRCTRWQSFAMPSLAEYMHIGDTTTRFTK